MFELMVSNIGQTPRMSAEEVQHTSINFALAGYLSNEVPHRQRHVHPHQQSRAVDAAAQDPEMMPGVIEEMLRYDAPAQLVDRYASRDVELAV